MKQFGLRFLVALVASVAIWLVVEPLYDRVVATIALPVVRVLEPVPVTAAVSMDGSDAIVHHSEEYAWLGLQRLELRTHHNNMPLLVALIAATPGLAPSRRRRAFAIGVGVLAATHVLYFVLSIHIDYALKNVGPYHVDDLRYFDVSWWQSLGNWHATKKLVVRETFELYTHVGRFVLPIVVWMALCGGARGRVPT